MTAGETNAVDFDVAFTDGSVRRVTARRDHVPSKDGIIRWYVLGYEGFDPEGTALVWAMNQDLQAADIRHVSPPSAAPTETAEKRLAALELFVAEWAHGAGWVRASDLGNYSDVMRRATAEREARLGIAGYGRNPAAEVANAAAEVLGGAVRVRTVNVGVSSGGAWSIEDAEEAIHAATWGRPVTGYVVGLGREMVVVLKPVPRCP